MGKADDKNPPGQAPDGTDNNNGYECDGNQGVGQSNPAHTGVRARHPAADRRADRPPDRAVAVDGRILLARGRRRASAGPLPRRHPAAVTCPHTRSSMIWAAFEAAVVTGKGTVTRRSPTKQPQLEVEGCGGLAACVLVAPVPRQDAHDRAALREPSGATTSESSSARS